MQRWDLTTPNDGERQGPSVLFSTSEARGVVLDLDENETMSDHQVRERAIVHVLHGEATITTPVETATCPQGTLIVLEPNETHSVHARERTRLLLLLAPWPAPGHYADDHENAHELPVNATQPPS